MPPSQLKRLKASLRDQGIIGPQKSKKQKKKAALDAKSGHDKRLSKTAALGNIREQFNPFEVKHNARGPKFQVTTNHPTNENHSKVRPGVTKSLGEQKRRDTLLVELQRRNKVGGVLDRRFGENDPTMDTEDKMVERFAREKLKNFKKSSLFDLEDDEPTIDLTHDGKPLTFDTSTMVDDFDEDDLASDSGSESSDESRRLKRRRLLEELTSAEDAEGDQPDRKKTKQEVMKEVIAKSKLYKYERQAAKEDDIELMAQLDKEMHSIQSLLFSGARTSNPTAQAVDSTAARPQLIAGVDKETFEKEFDLRLRQLAQDRRANPSDRTKSEEELAKEHAEKLKELEEKRLKRMRGEEDSDDSESEQDDAEEEDEKSGDDAPLSFPEEVEDDGFGLGKGIKTRPTATELGFDDEDDFFIEDDLVASGSDLELVEESDEESDDGNSDDGAADDDSDDDEFTKGLLNHEETHLPAFDTEMQNNIRDGTGGDKDGLPYTFPCPENLSEWLPIVASYPSEKLPTIIQRIRALYHPRLDSKNKEKMALFSRTLVDFISQPVTESTIPYAVLESVIRHLHSMAKTFPIEIGQQFRKHTLDICNSRSTSLHSGDLVLLTAIGTIFPTSDHFHQVVTPAMLSMARYLGQKIPRDLSDYSTGAYLCLLSLQFQHFSKRYVPEILNFALNTLATLSPSKIPASSGNFLVHPAMGSRISSAKGVEVRRLSFHDCETQEISAASAAELKVALLNTTIQTLEAAANLWSAQPAFNEVSEPVLRILRHLQSEGCRTELPDSVNEQVNKTLASLQRSLAMAKLSRRTVELHHHKPLAIKTYIPKFEDDFDPNKHYDPNRDRAELAKLKAEHKREKKGAMRELRKDSHFLAREKLKIKKTKDEAYEKKYKRLVAEIQGEEGRESNSYEREKSARKRARMRK